MKRKLYMRHMGENKKQEKFNFKSILTATSGKSLLPYVEFECVLRRKFGPGNSTDQCVDLAKSMLS